MKITDLKIRIVEVETVERSELHYHKHLGVRQNRELPVPPGRRPLYSYDLVGASPRLQRHSFLHVLTDEGVEGFCEGGFASDKSLIDKARSLLVGENPLYRELIWQKLLEADRLMYVGRRVAGTIDNCLWDIAAKVAGLPVYQTIGAVRDSIPCYWSAECLYPEQDIEDALTAKEHGYLGYKFHSFFGWKEDIANFRSVRDAVGPDLLLMQDACGKYTLEEARKVGRALEELDFFWFEEPLPDQHVSDLKSLVHELEIPVLATESFCGEMMHMVAQYLLLGATDLIRGTSRAGISTVLKLANLAELLNTKIELVSESNGPLFGIVGTHLSCAISNTSLLEDWRRQALAEEFGILNAPVATNGYMHAPSGAGFGVEIDWDWMNRHTVAEL